MSFQYWQVKRKIVFLSVSCILNRFQAWLGATVVYSVLQPVQITLHMLMALLIVALMVYLISELPKKNKLSVLYDHRVQKILRLALLLTIIQITLGTQVRQLIDEISKGLGYEQRDLWLSLVGNTFKIHRSFAISLVIVNGLLFIGNYRFKWI